MDYLFDAAVRQHGRGIVAKLLLHLRARQRIFKRTERMVAARGEGGAVAKNYFDLGLRAADARIGAEVDLIRGEGAECRIVVALRSELRQTQRPVMQDRRRGIVGGQQRLEFPFVGRKAAMHVESALTK